MAYCKNELGVDYNCKEALEDLRKAIRKAEVDCGIIREQFKTQPRRRV